MEVRVIKTCHGLKIVKFHDGALLPPNVGMVDLCEAWHLEAMEQMWAMAHALDRQCWQQLPASILQHPID